MINLKCPKMAEPCRIKYVNLRMAISAVEARGGFPMSVFFYKCPVLDDVQRWKAGSRAQAVEPGV